MKRILIHLGFQGKRHRIRYEHIKEILASIGEVI